MDDIDDSSLRPEERLELNLRTLAEVTGEDRYYSVKQSELTTAELTWVESFHALRLQYTSFINTYFLDTDWLRNDLFKLLGKHSEEPTAWDSLHLACYFSYSDTSGAPFSFDFKPWDVRQGSRAYREEVSAYFLEMLGRYIEETSKMFRRAGYKQATKRHETELLKWLVYWNVKRTSKDDILELVAAERNRDLYDLKTLNDHFRRFKSFGMPVRKADYPLRKKDKR